MHVSSATQCWTSRPLPKSRHYTTAQNGQTRRHRDTTLLKCTPVQCCRDRRNRNDQRSTLASIDPSHAFHTFSRASVLPV